MKFDVHIYELFDNMYEVLCFIFMKKSS